MLAEEHALAVRGVGTDADIGRNSQFRHRFLHGTDRPWHNVIRFAREHGVLILTIADAKKKKAGESRRRCGSGLADDFSE